MKINSTFHVSVLLIALLLLSTSVSFSQQNLSITEAKLTAERDARTDVGKAKWFGGGFLVTGGTLLVLRILVEVENDTENLALIVSGSSCLLHGGGLAAAFMSESVPPPTRLLGKSVEYVSYYTDAYRTESRRSKALWGAAGSLSGCLMVSGMLLIEQALRAN